jgi:hypothetical protein
VNEVEPNSDVPQAQKVELGTVVNGVIDAQTDVDYFKFTGKKAQRVLIHCAAGSIDSRARPFIEVYAGDGRTRIGLNHDYEGTDALCDVTLPSDGEYYIRISEFAYTAGGPDYFYRLTVGLATWLDVIYPPIVEEGQTTDVRLFQPVNVVHDHKVSLKHNVAARKHEVGFSGNGAVPQAFGLCDGFFETPSGFNSRPMFFATAPIILETEGDKSTPAKAQIVKAPCEIAGCIDVRNERDCYRFSAKKNEPTMIELFAARIGTNLDAVLSVKGPDGRELAGDPQYDDDPEAIHPTSFFNRTTDPAPFRLVPPADGDYTVTVSARDSNVNFGPRAIYRLRIAPPKPDFRAVVMARNRDNPSGVTVIPSGETALDVFAERRDGFAGPITFTIKGLPEGVTAKPAIIGTGQKWGMIILSGDEEIEKGEADVTVTATAIIDGKTVTRPVSSASITWNVPNANNTATIARLDRGLVIATRPGENAPYRLTANLEKATIKGTDGKDRPAGKMLAAKPGEKIALPVSIDWQGEGKRPNVVNLATEPTFSMQGQNAVSANNGQPIPVPKDKNETTITLDIRQNIAPGLYNVMLRGDTKAQMTTDMEKKTKKEFTVMAFAEPFAVKVLPVSLGKLTASPSGPVKPGQSTTLILRVERQFDFAGEFPVKIAFPPNSGLSADDGAIPAGANEAKITVNASKDAKPGNVPNVAIEAMPLFDGDAVPHKTQANFTIAK